MKKLSTVFICIVVALAIIGAFFSDLLENIAEKFFYDDSILAVLCMILIALTLLSSVYFVVYYDIPGVIESYYRELCLKLIWKT